MRSQEDWVLFHAVGGGGGVWGGGTADAKRFGFFLGLPASCFCGPGAVSDPALGSQRPFSSKPRVFLQLPA